MTSDPGVPRCAVHPDRDALQTCSRCGNYSCIDCLPGGSLSTTCLGCEEVTGSSRYHVVPAWRFLLMCLLSAGTYPLYWFFKNWQSIKRADRSDIWPLPRAFFASITYFTLINDLNLYKVARAHAVRDLSVGLGIGYLAMSMLFRLPDPWWLVSLGAVLFLLPAVNLIWASSNANTRAKAGHWALRHTIVAVLGALFWGLALVGLMAEPTRSNQAP